jgi:hypothetical protein
VNATATQDWSRHQPANAGEFVIFFFIFSLLITNRRLAVIGNATACCLG